MVLKTFSLKSFSLKEKDFSPYLKMEKIERVLSLESTLQPGQALNITDFILADKSPKVINYDPATARCLVEISPTLVVNCDKIREIDWQKLSDLLLQLGFTGKEAREILVNLNNSDPRNPVINYEIGFRPWIYPHHPDMDLSDFEYLPVFKSIQPVVDWYTFYFKYNAISDIGIKFEHILSQGDHIYTFFSGKVRESHGGEFLDEFLARYHVDYGIDCYRKIEFGGVNYCISAQDVEVDNIFRK